jgi:hypothetical protein
VAEATETEKITGSSSNARFRQLIRAGITQSETVFHAKASNSRKPDNRYDGDHALEKGECGFGYIGNVPHDDRVSRPIALTPLVPGTDRFDPQPFSGKAVILWTDGSVQSFPIERASGQVLLDGKNLLDPTQPFWAGTVPLLVLPE